eukprot:GFUD01043917.1.p1 GENE.GFUD01043917.1~~GFUD01043917.1.p1  ORF type:complete len:617 (+),score=100.08 GFUD01043917.1:143-1852(+)
MSSEWQKKVLCRYYMMGVCQRGDDCPYSHDRSISNKGTLPCRFFQSGTCANGSNCRFSHGTPDQEPIQQLTIHMESFAFDQSDGSEGSYEPSMGSFDANGYMDVMDQSLVLDSGGFMDPSYMDPGATGYYNSLPLGTISPTYYTSNEYPDSLYGEGMGGFANPSELSSPSLELSSPDVLTTVSTEPPVPKLVSPSVNTKEGPQQPLLPEPTVIFSPTTGATTAPDPSLSSPEFVPRAVSILESPAPPTVEGPNPQPSDKVPEDGPVLVPLPGSAPWRAPNNWAEAAEFVPKVEKPRSWAQVVNTGVTYAGCELSTGEAESALCPFYRVGECRYGEGCAYIHGETCDYCGQACLHPTHIDQRRSHLAECLQEHERNMELSFAVARSKEKTCGICMETVLEKPKGEARFGILPSCNHCFCLPCIRKWRQAKQFEHKIIRACPECRQTSDYICPSRFWVETPEEKERLLTDYKKNLGQKECKYFNKGTGECPFGNKCFYQHADKDGRVVDVGPPKKPLRRANAEGNLTLVQRLLLYDFLEERDGQLVLPLDFVELLDLYSDSDEWSDSEETN